MTTNNWTTAQSGDWTDAADWSSGSAPIGTDSVTIAAAGAYIVTLYSTGAVAGLTLNDAGLLFYEAGTLAVSGTIALDAGTLALAYGTLQGGTLALDGGVFEAQGGTLAGVAVQGPLTLAAAESTLFVTGGLSLAGAGGSGHGSLSLTGAYAALDFLGSQGLNAATVTIGNATGPDVLGIAHAFGASSAATLTLGSSLWLRQTGGQGELAIGGSDYGGPPLTDMLLNRGTITVSGGTLTTAGSGVFDNAGTIGVSGGAVLDIACGFVNTGTIAVSNAMLDLGGSFASSLIDGLGALTLSSAVLEIGGTAENGGATLTVGAGTGPGAVTLAGTIAGGTVIDTGGGLLFGPGTGVLDGVTYEGTLTIAQAGAGLTLADGSVIETNGGTGIASITGAGAALLLEGVTALDAATITLGSTGAAAAIGTTDALLASAATTATLGAALVIDTAGNAAIDANAQTPVPGVGLSDTLISQATIDVMAGTLTLGGYGTLINAGSISVSHGATLLAAAAAFSNTGTISIAAGGTVELGAPGDPYASSSWSNSGAISTAGTLELGGEVATNLLGSITESAGGTIALLGTLDNAGSTLTLGNGGTLPSLSLAGTITGGTVVDRGARLAAGTAGGALLDGVSYAGTLALAGAREYLRIRDGLMLAGQADITGAGAVLAFQGSQIFTHATVELGAAGAAAAIDLLHDYSKPLGDTLTLGAGLAVIQAGALAEIGLAADIAGDAIVNAGSITAGIAGGTFTLGGAGFSNTGTILVSNTDTLAIAAGSFSNTGSISITNATLAIDGEVTLAALGALALANAAVSVAGTLNATGGTLTLGAGSAWGRLGLTGTIVGGTIVNEGGGLLAGGGATLDGVIYQGALDLSRPFQSLAIAGGITLESLSGTAPGTVLLTGPVTRLAVLDSETIDNATIYVGDASLMYNNAHVAPPELVAGPGATLTLGAGVMVRTANLFGTIGDAAYGQWTDSIVNDGVILAGSAGGTLTIGSSFFLNEGALLIGGNDNVVIGDVGFTNEGVIALTLGSALLFSLWNYYAAPDAGATIFSNAGTLRMVGGTVAEITGNGLFPAVPLANLPGGIIQGVGTILAPVVNNGVIESSYGPDLALTGAISGTGALLIDPKCILELAGTVAASQTVSFSAAGETLKLDLGSGFAAAVANFSTGDTLDLSGTALQALALSSGTLVATPASGSNFRLNTTSLLAGELSGGPDGRGGTDIVYTAQARGGAAVAIPATAPAMLFWASPVGDVFTGPSADLNGARIGNWGVTDGIDLIDMVPASAQFSYAQGTGQGVLSLTDGTHTASITIFGTWNASWFHLANDGSGGTLVSYHI